MLKFVYLAIVAFVLVLIAVNMFRKKKNFFFQLDAAIVMVTLLLRLLAGNRINLPIAIL